MRILSVDDSEEIMFHIQSFLESAGYTDILTANSASEAFELLRAKTNIDLILMDIMMPEMDGIESCKEIKSDKALWNIPVIMVTGRTDNQSLSRAFEAGAIDFIPKPLNRVELLARVRSALRLKKEIDWRTANEEELEIKNEALEKAINQVRLLHGLIPVCSHCKKIQNEEGDWQPVGVYLAAHSDVSICEECARKSPS